jgi:hypothetical protein
MTLDRLLLQENAAVIPTTVPKINIQSDISSTNPAFSASPSTGPVVEAEAILDMLLVGILEAVGGEVGPVGVTRPPVMVPIEGEPTLVLILLEDLTSATTRPGTYCEPPTVPAGVVEFRHESSLPATIISIVPSRWRSTYQQRRGL